MHVSIALTTRLIIDAHANKHNSAFGVIKTNTPAISHMLIIILVDVFISGIKIDCSLQLRLFIHQVEKGLNL
jgi:hypothetical protein